MKLLKRKKGSPLNTPQNALRRQLLALAGIDADLYQVLEKYDWYDVVTDREKIIGFVLKKDGEYIYGFQKNCPRL